MSCLGYRGELFCERRKQHDHTDRENTSLKQDIGNLHNAVMGYIEAA